MADCKQTLKNQQKQSNTLTQDETDRRFRPASDLDFRLPEDGGLCGPPAPHTAVCAQIAAQAVKVITTLAKPFSIEKLRPIPLCP
ncbi:hypothetical protein QWZ10_13850 [Paracoccus cavernae]|uniref:Uncharacterized protein n=1 Tax=Paracoccus cavernae TaxID=1571207 RepID=A0ABT8DAT1_9RHOB|nr:hypothetical protein [Paracoccus cavernae]